MMTAVEVIFRAKTPFALPHPEPWIRKTIFSILCCISMEAVMPSAS